MTQKAYLEMKPRPEAQARWLAALAECGWLAGAAHETVATAAALDRILAEPVRARRSVPHYNSAAMDGIAVRAADTFAAGDRHPVWLPVLAPGTPFADGGCYAVNTGAPLPAGTDAVVMIEHVVYDGGRAEVMAPAIPWQHVRLIGEDLVEHELILAEDEPVTPEAMAALLAAGVDEVAVVARPRLAVIPTGSELVATQAELAPGKILDVNSHMLCAAACQCGSEARRCGIVPDDKTALQAAVKNALADSDLVVVNAGTSAGTEDHAWSALDTLGRVLVHGIATKPGKPVILALVDGKPVVGLPGYPVSAKLTFDLFVKPALYARQHKPLPKPGVLTGKLAKTLPSEVGVEEYLRVVTGDGEDGKKIVPLGRGAGMISSLVRADGFLTVPADCAGLAAGSLVTVTLSDRGLVEAPKLLAVGSHDLALDLLGMHLKRRCGARLACANVGSSAGVLAIRNGEAQLAGVHILDEATGTYNLPYIRRMLAGRSWQLVHLARREQGFLVRPGNPKQIRRIEDLFAPGVTFVNRQRGSGTRMLLDHCLRQKDLPPEKLNGYTKETATHMAVAATVAAGAADAGLGIRAAAVSLGLDFVPLDYERYDLLVTLRDEDPVFHALLAVLRDEAFHSQVEAMGGYDLAAAGEVVGRSEVGPLDTYEESGVR